MVSVDSVHCHSYGGLVRVICAWSMEYAYLGARVCYFVNAGVQDFLRPVCWYALQLLVRCAFGHIEESTEA